MSRKFDTGDALPGLVDPDDPLQRRPPDEMAGLLLLLTPEEFAAVENLVARSGMSVGELGLRALAYGLTVLEASQRQIEHNQP